MSEVLVGLASAGLGFVSGLLVPWIKWEVEKRKAQQASRQQALAAWRSAVDSMAHDASDERSGFLNSSEYASLRVHLDPEVIKKVEDPRTVYVPGGRSGHARNHMLLDEIARIEKEWGLI